MSGIANRLSRALPARVRQLSFAVDRYHAMAKDAHPVPEGKAHPPSSAINGCNASVSDDHLANGFSPSQCEYLNGHSFVTLDVKPCRKVVDAGITPLEQTLQSAADNQTALLFGVEGAPGILHAADLARKSEDHSALKQAVFDAYGLIQTDERGASSSSNIIALCEAHAVDEAYYQLKQMTEVGQWPPWEVFQEVMVLLAHSRKSSELRDVFDLTWGKRWMNDSTLVMPWDSGGVGSSSDWLHTSKAAVSTFSAVIKEYINEQQFEQAEALFRLMQNVGITPNAQTFNMILHMYASQRQSEQVHAVLADMAQSQVQCDRLTFNLLLTVCSRSNDIDSLEAVVQAMTQQGLEPDLTAYNCLIDAYGKAGRLDAIEALLGDMRDRGISLDIFTYQALVHAFTVTGQAGNAQAILENMRLVGIAPQLQQYTSILSAYAKAGDIDSMEACLQEMQQAGVPLDAPVYGCLVQAYGSAQLLSKVNRLKKEIVRTHRHQAATIFAEVGHLFVRAYGKKWAQVDRFLIMIQGLPDGKLCLNSSLFNAAVISFVLSGQLTKAEELLVKYVESGKSVPRKGLAVLFESYHRRRMYDKTEATLQWLLKYRVISSAEVSDLAPALLDRLQRHNAQEAIDDMGRLGAAVHACHAGQWHQVEDWLSDCEMQSVSAQPVACSFLGLSHSSARECVPPERSASQEYLTGPKVLPVVGDAASPDRKSEQRPFPHPRQQSSDPLIELVSSCKHGDEVRARKLWKTVQLRKEGLAAQSGTLQLGSFLAGCHESVRQLPHPKWEWDYLALVRWLSRGKVSSELHQDIVHFCQQALVHSELHPQHHQMLRERLASEGLLDKMLTDDTSMPPLGIPTPPLVTPSPIPGTQDSSDG